MKTIRSLSDRLLSLVVPKIDAEAATAAPCIEGGWCALCGSQGSMPLKQWCYVYAVCRVERGPAWSTTADRETVWRWTDPASHRTAAKIHLDY